MNESTALLRPASIDDVPLILQLIKELAVYERMLDEVVATEEMLREAIFGAKPAAEVVLCEVGEEPAGFALFFQNFSTFKGRPGIYLEDLYVRPNFRGHGYGKLLLGHLAQICIERNYVRLEWAVLDWNTPSIGFYKNLGAVPMDEWTVFRLTGEKLSELAKARLG